MGKLVPAALRREPDFFTEQLGPTNLTDYSGVFDRAAARIESLDPDGREAYAVLKQLQLQAER